MAVKFRFDDVCLNAKIDLINDIANYLYFLFPDAQIIFGISPLVHDNCGERVYPEILNASSDYKQFFNVARAGIPAGLHPAVTLASHGLVHPDHRLMGYEAQELSIRISCSLTKSKIFIPPFNKWNKFTDEICEQNDIELIRFEDGWLSMEHNRYNPNHKKWYLHARYWTMEKIKDWFK